MSFVSPRLVACSLAFLIPAGGCTAEREPESPHSTDEPLGFVDFSTSCDAAVRDDFNRGLALFHHMTYPVARSTFERVTERDPDCAMGYWGAAMTLFQPLWPTRPGAAELEKGWALMQEARRRGSGTDREEMFVRAAEAFFDPSLDPDYWARIERWAAATTELYEAFPDDLEVRSFFALTQLATASRFGAAADHHSRAQEVLATVLREEPTHPGAIHYTIHANDFAGRQDQALDVVRSYGEIAPQNPHALHMPSHIFVRLGEWDEVVRWNLRAAEAALAQRVGPSNEFVWDEYPHAVEYLAYAYLQQGRDDEAEGVIREINLKPDLEPSFKTAFHLASTASRFVLERKDWSAAAELPVRSPTWVNWDRYTWPEAIAWFTRGLGAAHIGDAGGVAQSLARLEALSARATEAGEGPFASEIDVLLFQLMAWKAHHDGQPDSALDLLARAIELDEATPKNPVTPGAQLPAMEMLGELYLELDDPRRAWEAFEQSDAVAPGRFNTILGMARSAAAIGDEARAQEHYSRLAELAWYGSSRDGVLEAERFLAR
jgi:tetratricopeptide (TPR) repeat protein